MNNITKEELNKYRNDTAGCSGLVHFNNAGASLPPDVVIDTIVDYLKEEATYGGYETEYKNIARIEGVYQLIADLVGAEKEEVAIFENASAAWGTAFKGLTFQEGDEIITCEMEYVTNMIGLADVRKKGIKVIVVGNDANGNFPLADLEKAINSKTKLIAVTHIPSSGGGILPINEIGKVANKHQVLYMVDACQTAGQYPIDVKEIGCDILSATGRKYMRAPRGTGFLFVKRSVQDKLSPVLMDFLAASNVSLDGYTLRNDARRFELYEKSRALTLGLGKAIEYALTVGLDRIWQRVQYLADLARTELSSIPGVTVHDIGSELCGIVTFSVEGIDSMAVRNKLVENGINVSFGGSQATPIYMEKHGLKGIVRASLHYYNKESEIATMCDFLKEHPFVS
ncbi:Selenocysteine lyase/Cysteine desulfurase [Mucilaginibacter pineti]|uniref:Selenocysteine lyase/Cysteine desulfurase n=1 Tax=Mucilaginibacter pineti TaxID=1391627 RepID=A0A1G7P0U2_9SPHI|nr:aminotransferase class V-fold PLP-dependent enzyme [Mucilaginibacter pineti]SDF79938.1 Selenocysteine lyase/Cysteine desulfurase [Mucilaginibacter pineti]